MLSGVFATIEQANSFYEEKRGVRVSYESQLRYLNYFHKFVTEGVDAMNFQPMKLSRLIAMTKADEYFLDKEFTVTVMDFTTGKPTQIAQFQMYGDNAQRLDNGMTLLYADCKDFCRCPDVTSC